MAFLDNSGDIILDAVLTDTGRYRLAQGNGSFKISKFALGDDEIDYGSYNKNNPSGSAYYDLEILQTPILEAFTNNTSTMKSKLLTIPRTNLLYMPVIMQNNRVANAKPSGSSEMHWVLCDAATVGTSGINGRLAYAGGTGGPGAGAGGGSFSFIQGVLNGFQPGYGISTQQWIQCDQGINSNQIAAGAALDADLFETQYIIEMDNRLGSIVPVGEAGGATAAMRVYNMALGSAVGTGTGANRTVTAGTAIASAKVSFIDDDNIASYYLSLATDTGIVDPLTPSDNAGAQGRMISGPQGTMIRFRVQASIELQTSTYLFEKLGRTAQMDLPTRPVTQQAIRYIDTIIKVTGATTGYSIDLPVRYVKSVPPYNTA